MFVCFTALDLGEEDDGDVDDDWVVFFVSPLRGPWRFLALVPNFPKTCRDFIEDSVPFIPFFWNTHDLDFCLFNRVPLFSFLLSCLTSLF